MFNKVFAYTIVGTLLASSLPACNSENHDPSAAVEATGDLRFPLEATAASGNVYRLRAAQLSIAGPENTLVSPPDDSSTSFTTELDSGLYSIELLPGWQLWRMGMTEQLVEAELVSPNPIIASILADTETVVTFQFRAGDDVVVLGPGDLTVEIAVDEVTTCSSDMDCPAGEVCQAGQCVVVGVCGDGVIDPGEACDDGNATGGDGCSAACAVEFCGNGVLEATEECDDGNATSGDGCSAACTNELTGNHLVINEIDYDQVGSDTQEFVEIYNGTANAVSLANLALVFINGFSASEYSRVQLAMAGAGMLASGQYLVVGSPNVIVPANALSLTTLTNDNIQNGAPDGVALVDLATAQVIDALSYEGTIGSATINGLGAVSLGGNSPVDFDDNVSTRSLVRLPNGFDTDAGSDWMTSPTPTPGAPN